MGPDLVSAQDGEGDPVAVRLTDRLYALQGVGGNVGVAIGEDGVLLVDGSYTEMSDAVLAEIGALTDLPLRFVVNTHWHHDHTDGNDELAKADAIIVAHEKARRRMIVEQVIVPPMTGGRAPALPEDGWPVVSFTDELTFHLGGVEIRAIHVPNAHTDGDALVQFVDEDVIHLGDLLFSRQYPNIDVGSGGTIDGVIAALEFALGIAGRATRFIPGHGEVASREDIEATIGMLKTVRDRVAALADAGLTQDEVVARKPLADLEEEWGQGYVKADRMVIQAYKSLVGGED